MRLFVELLTDFHPTNHLARSSVDCIGRNRLLHPTVEASTLFAFDCGPKLSSRRGTAASIVCFSNQRGGSMKIEKSKEKHVLNETEQVD
jgi:hypothetical protein